MTMKTSPSTSAPAAAADGVPRSAALLLLALLFASKRIGRAWGALMLIAYAAYMVFLFWNGMAA